MDVDKIKQKTMLWVRRIVFGSIAAVVIVFALYTTFTLEYSYSKGERTGYVQTLSKKGWMCKTDEGELTLIANPGQPQTTFLFTVRDDDVTKQIGALAGHRVVLEYEEHRGIPSSCFGETSTFVTSVREAK